MRTVLTGTEEELGTPVEDMMHLKIINGLDIKQKYILSIGIDIDTAHRIKLNDILNRMRDLENYKIEEQRWDLKDPNVAKYRDIVNNCQPINSIAQSLIIAALENQTGYYTPEHLKPRITENIVYLNPRICTAYIYPLSKIAMDVIYLDKIRPEMNTEDVDDLISDFHYNLLHNKTSSIN